MRAGRGSGNNWRPSGRYQPFAYLLVVWLVGAGRLVIFGPAFDNAFLISILIVPLYLLLDRLGQWVTTSVLGTLHSSTAEPAAEDIGIEKASESPETARRVPEGHYGRIARLIARLVILISLTFWLMGIWGIQIPFGQTILRTALKIFLTLLLAHLAWGFTNRLIDRKLAKKKELTETEEHAADEGEWGAAATQDRSHTLLPIVRKFIGTVLAVMVVLNVISAFGVNIGPLLAGAGILGLAVGFGAQKIVRDIISGFFFLMDDAFRIGEYIQTSKMSGMVEAITLRNVMLRHHRGPLQIVPHSELGSITNYMRGNVVEKFNIELPYNTDIDAVRKVIKKVGQELLADEEMGPNFIEPLKSQGGARRHQFGADLPGQVQGQARNAVCHPAGSLQTAHRGLGQEGDLLRRAQGDRRPSPAGTGGTGKRRRPRSGETRAVRIGRPCWPRVLPPPWLFRKQKKRAKRE